MKNYEKEMINVIRALDESQALKHVVITGSWALYFYSNIFNGFVPRTETTDLDLYLPNPKKAIGENLSTKMRQYTYKKNNDYLTGKTTFLSEDGFSVEFLVVPDRTMSNTIKIEGLDVVAEALPKTAPLGWNSISVCFENWMINIVSPVSFVLQKLLINKERKPEYKKIKDIDAVIYVLGFIKASKKYQEELVASFETYPKKWKKTILETAKENRINLFK